MRNPRRTASAKPDDLLGRNTEDEYTEVALRWQVRQGETGTVMITVPADKALLAEHVFNPARDTITIGFGLFRRLSRLTQSLRIFSPNRD